MNDLTKIVTKICALFPQDGSLVRQVIEKIPGCVYERHGVVITGTFVPVITVVSGYDVIHGNWLLTNKYDIATLVNRTFPGYAYILSKTTCVPAVMLVKELVNNIPSGMTVCFSHKVVDYVDVVEIVVMSGSDHVKLNLNGIMMGTYSFSELKKGNVRNYIARLGLAA